MRHAETVTFGGGGLDRAAELRGDAAQETLRRDPGARTLLFWRGKVLVDGDEALRVARIPLGDPVLADAISAPVFLGRAPEGPLFACDISPWMPEDVDTEALGGFVDQTEQRHPALPPALRFAELRAIMTRLPAHCAELAATGKAIFGWHASHGFCARCGEKSDMAMGGWQRTCPVCRAQHFPRTDPVVIMLVTHGNSLLLGRSPHWPEQMYSLLAGFVEPGETLEAAVRREVWEEAGVKVGAVRYLASQPWPFPASLMMGCAGEALTTDINLDPVELEAALWVPRERLLNIFAGKDNDIRAPRNGAIAQFLMRAWLADRLD